MKYVVACLLLIIQSYLLEAQQIMPLYNDSIPNSIAGKDEETITYKDGIMIVSKVSRPTLTAYLPSPAIATGTAVIVCPGGAYSILAASHEGSEVAKELNKVGVAVFVLKYRIPSDATMPNKEIGPLQDAQQAIKTIRSRATEWNINPAKIGIMGFSAGGHLAASAGVHYTKALIENPTNISLRPDFLILIYPVISFQDSLTHSGSRNNLLGKNVSQAKKDYYSNELQVTDNTPTTFLVHATDDNAVKVDNSIKFYEALVQHHVPAEIHIYEKGGHGFGTLKHNITTDSWMDRLVDWLKQRNLLVQSEKAQTNEEQMKLWKKKSGDLLHNDWANLGKYAADNKQLPPTKTGENRVVFMGNSITEFWKERDSIFFEGKPYIDRGISGQTTPQMLVRFKEDVINLQPKLVVILAGINDIAENTGPIALENVFGNIVSMAVLAKANNIKVVLSSVLPANHFPWRPEIAPAEKVIQLNDMIKAYANKNNIVYVDYYSAMVDEKKGLKTELTYDGVHPTTAGYKVMGPLVEKAIAEALKREH